MAEEYDLQTDELIGKQQVVSCTQQSFSIPITFMYLRKPYTSQYESGEIKAHLEPRAHGRWRLGSHLQAL